MDVFICGVSTVDQVFAYVGPSIFVATVAGSFAVVVLSCTYWTKNVSPPLTEAITAVLKAGAKVANREAQREMEPKESWLQ
jgi:hypothetical protein